MYTKHSKRIGENISEVVNEAPNETAEKTSENLKQLFREHCEPYIMLMTMGSAFGRYLS